MAEPTFSNSPAVGADSFSSVLEGRILDVDTKRYTVTVQTEGAGRTYPDLPIMSFYAHPERGEGGYLLPAVGAPCYICTDGGGGSGKAFVLGFRRLPKAVTSSENLDQPPQEGDEVMADHSSFLPRRLQGEFGWTTRDGSFLHYRKGGIVEIGSKASCQRLYIPLGNHIRDICENYGQLTAAGYQYFEGGRVEGSDGTDAEARWRIMVKAKAADTMASVLLDAGFVDGKRFRLVIAPTAVKMGEQTWESASETYHLFIDEAGNLDEKASSVTKSYSEYRLDVSGSKMETIGGDSVEIITGEKTITAEKIYLTALLTLVNGGFQVMGPLEVIGPTTLGSAITLGGVSLNPVAFQGLLNNHIHLINPVAPGETLSPTVPILP